MMAAKEVVVECKALLVQGRRMGQTHAPDMLVSHLNEHCITAYGV
jgi:hypothetical protein